VKIVVAFAPGTGSDVLARLVANAWALILGGTVIVDNRPGGGGIVGTESVARSPADGYTITLGTTSTLVTNPALNPNVKYSVEKDFAPVAGLGKAWYVIVTANTPEAPKTLQELVARLSRSRARSLGGAGHDHAPRLRDVPAPHGNQGRDALPYKGSSQALTDVTGGQVLFAPTPSPRRFR
jgi:tripartite-type tricarboxylate transporter receptor subunit TctC